MFPNHWWFSENKIIGKNPEKNNFKLLQNTQIE